MVPCQAKSPYPLIAEEGDVVRLTAVNGPYYSFIGLCKRWHDDGEMKDTPGYYLLHESEFSITWTRSGPTTGDGPRGVFNGEDMEADWFMYYAEEPATLPGDEPEELPGDLCAGASKPATVITITMAGGGSH